MAVALILSTALVAAAPQCAWTHPGANPYRADPVQALADFAMPDSTRRALRASMAAHRYTDVATITRDDIAGTRRYADLREMHSGHGQVCHGNVDRSAWSPKHRERGLVYCADEVCVIVPTVCNNVSLVSRRLPVAMAPLDEEPIDIEPAAGPPAGLPGAVADMPPAAPEDVPQAFLPPAVAGPGGPEDGGTTPTAPGDGFPSTPTGWTPGGDDTPCCTIAPGGPGGPVTPGNPGGVSPVPETPASLLLLLGLTTCLRRRRR